MKSIGVGVIGTGFMGKAHSIAYSSSGSVFGTSLRPKLEIVCDLSPSRAKNRATDLGFARYTDKWQEVVNDPKVDLISVCTPNNTHAEISLSALRVSAAYSRHDHPLSFCNAAKTTSLSALSWSLA